MRHRLRDDTESRIDPYAAQMKNTLLIVSEDQEKTNIFQERLAGSGYETVHFPPGAAPDPAIIGELFMALVPDCSVDPTSMLSEVQFPNSLPVLVVGESLSPPPFLTGVTSSRLVDYLGGRIDKAALKAKVAFLHRVAKIGFERDSFLKHHENFLDWFASRDGLTGLYNRHHFNRLLSEWFGKAVADGMDLSLLLFDIDYFSDINKTCGRSFGDFVLNELSARLTKTTRKQDRCFRISGGEFAVLMPGAGIVSARRAAGEILSCCEAKPYSRQKIERRATLSIGVASLRPNTPTSADEFVNMAETALFRAKAEGRNRVYTFSPQKADGTPPSVNNFDTVKLAINRLLDKTRNATISSLQLLARDIAGPSHREHIERVSRYIELLCSQLGLTTPIIRTLQNAAILHTCIRHLIHNDLLSKKEKFSKEEIEIMQDFPYKLSEIVEIFDYFSQERLILLTRTERFDGKGYPDGLRGNEIPLGARIISVIDSFAAMEANRPHRTRLEPKGILAELKNEAGRQFDPYLVLKLLDIIEQNNLLEVEAEEMAEIRAGLLTTLAHKGP